MTVDGDFDDRVRQALDPDAAAVDRMVDAALERGSARLRRTRRPLRLVVAAAAVLVGALWTARQMAPPSPPPDDFVLTRAGDVVMIQSAAGETWIIGPAAPPDPAKAGTGYVIVEGDPK